MKVKKSKFVFHVLLLLAIPLLILPESLWAKEKTYRSNNCPITLTVPDSISLHDVEGWTEPVQRTACRISLTWEGKIKSPLPDKSFDDVRILSDIVMDVKNVPLKDRLDGLNFYLLAGSVLYKGPELSIDAKSMGYKLLRTRPIKHFTVKNGEMYVGIQDYLEVYGRKGKRRQSTSYVFLIGNDTYSFDVQVTYDKTGKSNDTKIDSLFKLFRSSNFNSNL